MDPVVNYLLLDFKENTIVWSHSFILLESTSKNLQPCCVKFSKLDSAFIKISVLIGGYCRLYCRLFCRSILPPIRSYKTIHNITILEQFSDQSQDLDRNHTISLLNSSTYSLLAHKTHEPP